MEDSFFGFDTSAPLDDDGGEVKEGSEDEWDAINDETFGEAVNTDWENIHENLVRLDGHDGTSTTKLSGGSRIKDDDENSDLGINLSRVKLDEIDMGTEDLDFVNHIQLDPSVWANPITKSPAPVTISQHRDNKNAYPNPEHFLRTHFPNPFDIVAPIQNSNQFCAPPRGKICTVEDIEKNIRNQQQQQQQQQQHQHQQQQQNQHQLQQQQHQHHQQQQLQPQQQNHRNPVHTSKPLTPNHMSAQPGVDFFNRLSVPPGFNGQRPPNYNMPPPLHSMNMMPGPYPSNRLPPGFPPVPMMGGSLNVQPLPPHPVNFNRQLSHNLPIALNNFAMHPNFNAMRPIGTPMPGQRMLNHPLLPPPLAMMGQGLLNSANNFNQRLVQEIQQNHPLLSVSRNPNIFNNHHNNHNMQQQQQQQQQQQHHQKVNGKVNPRSTGNLPTERDEYANLMSTRDKHWLIGIQLSQLNTETPYIDDYYYTVFQERKSIITGNRQSKAHKDNQLNHPLIQPKGHAQLVLISMGKNGTHARNGQSHNRERHNSESKNDKEPVRNFTPLQFENSLGKLQYGSVTAPRKIIDMDVMAAENTQQFNTSVEVSTQRKSRQLLLHIESLYKIVLKLEDLTNPAAIASTVIYKERKEKEKQLALEQATTNGLCSSESARNSAASSLSDNLDSKDDLTQKLLVGLSFDKVVAIMNVRKGKILIRRIMPHISDHPVRWTVWSAVFSAIQNILKKDKEECDSILLTMYPELKNQISQATMENLIGLGNAMPLNDKKLNNFFFSKFCISSLIAVLLRAEELYTEKPEMEIEMDKKWCDFLEIIANSLNRTIQQQSINAAIEKEAIAPLGKHLSRFNHLNLDSLIALFSHAKEQLK